MGGVIGATSGKFVIVAAMLMLHGGIDNTRTGIAIAPGAPRSSIAPDVKARDRIAIGIGALTTYADTPAPSAQPDAATRLTIGRDLLDVNTVLIDFPSHRVRLLIPSEARRIEARMIAVPVTDRPDGGLTVPLAIDHAPPATALLDLASPTAVTAVVPHGGSIASIGPVDLPGIAIASGLSATVGLLAFTRSTVIFDLAHHRIWMKAQN